MMSPRPNGPPSARARRGAAAASRANAATARTSRLGVRIVATLAEAHPGRQNAAGAAELCTVPGMLRLGLVFLLLAACAGSGTAVSSTTTAHKRAESAPPPPDRAVSESTGETPVPTAGDAHERIAYLRAGSIF